MLLHLEMRKPGGMGRTASDPSGWLRVVTGRVERSRKMDKGRKAKGRKSLQINVVFRETVFTLGGNK